MREFLLGISTISNTAQCLTVKSYSLKLSVYSSAYEVSKNSINDKTTINVIINYGNKSSTEPFPNIGLQFLIRDPCGQGYILQLGIGFI